MDPSLSPRRPPRPADDVSPPPQRRTLDRAGYSLAELLCVIVILGLGSRLAAPAFSSMTTGSRVSGATMAVQGDLALTRAQAVRHGSAASFRAGGTATYTVTVDTAGVPMSTVKTGNMSEYKTVTVSVPGGVVTFGSRGLMTSPAVGSGYVKVTVAKGARTDSVLVYANGRITHGG